MSKNKKILSVFLALIMALSAFTSVPLSASAAQVDAVDTGDTDPAYPDYEYSVKDGEATVTAYAGSETDVVIPDTLGGCPVTAIGYCAFCFNESLCTVTIPETVTKIDEWAFEECTALTEITIPASVTAIGKDVFSSCSDDLTICGMTNSYADRYARYHHIGFVSAGETEAPAEEPIEHYLKYTVTDGQATVTGYDGLFSDIEIPDELGGYPVTKIGKQAFQGEPITSVKLPDSVTEIGQSAFSRCSFLTEITIPDLVTEIASSTFSNCSSLRKVTLPEGLQNIDSWAFGNCPDDMTIYGYAGTYAYDYAIMFSLNFVAIGVGAIDTSGFTYTITDNEATITAFDGHMKNFVIPDSIDGYPVTAIGERAFYDTLRGGSLFVPDTVKEIGDFAFAFASFHRVILPEGLKKISSGAFYACNFLTEINIPESVTEIGYSAFYNAGCLKSITLPEGLQTIGSGAFQGCDHMTQINIPDSVTKIGNEAFRECSSLTEIDLPDALTGIGDEAFCECTALTEIALPDSVTGIGKEAFSGCTALIQIDLPDSVTGIGKEAFSGCTALTGITIPGSVTALGDSVFSSCSSLSEVTISGPVEQIEKNVFSGCSALSKITIPECTKISENAFDDCSDDLTIYGYTRSYAEDYALEHDINFVSIGTANDLSRYFTYTVNQGEATVTGCRLNDADITIPETLGGCPVTAIGDNAFRECATLEHINFPDSLVTIGDYAFDRCTGLTAVSFPDSLVTIGDYAFDQCAGLTTVSFPDSLVTIGNHAFDSCTGLTAVSFSDSLDTIGNYAFRYCPALAGITLPESIRTIGHGAFMECRSIIELNLPEGLQMIGSGAFDRCTGLTEVTIPENTKVSDTSFSGVSPLTVYGYTYSPAYDYLRRQTGITFISIGEAKDRSHYYAYKIKDGEATVTNYWGSEEDIVIPDTLGGCPVTAVVGLFSAMGWDTVPGDEPRTPPHSLTIPAGVKYIGETYEGGGLFAVAPAEIIILSRDAVIDTLPEDVSNCVVRGYKGSTAEAFDKHPINFVPFDEDPLENPDYDFVVYGGKAFITRYKGSEKNVVVPSAIGGYPVGEIGYRNEKCTDPDCEDFSYDGDSHTHKLGAFEQSDVQSVTLPATLTAIGTHAFKDCAQLRTINIPEGVAVIGDHAFGNCSALESIHIPASVTDICVTDSQGSESLAFMGCSGLRSVTVDENNPVYDSRENCSAIIVTENNTLIFGCRSTVIPATVTEIGISAFEDCTGLTGMVIPDSVLEINTNAFKNCTGLTDLRLPAAEYISDKEGKHYVIENDAFKGCTGLQRVVIPEQITLYDLWNCLFGVRTYWVGYESYTEKDPDSNLVIYGYYGTDAERYATEYGIPFRMIAPATSDEVSVDAPDGTTYSVVQKATEDQASPDESIPIHNQPLPEGSILLDVYDITLRSAEDETPIQPTSPVTVRIRCDHPNAHVFRSEADGSLTDMNARYEDGYLIFEVDHFSIYLVVELGADVDLALCGDADGDGDVTALDVATIQRACASLPVLTDPAALRNADVNGDGEVDIIDATYLQRYLALMEVPYPVGERV